LRLALDPAPAPSEWEEEDHVSGVAKAMGYSERDTARAMSQKANVEAVKRAYAAMERGDIPALLELCDPEIEFDSSDSVFDPTVFHGHKGLLDFFSRSADMWESQRFEAQEFIPAGDDRVLIPHRVVSVGRDGVEVVARNANLVTLREGKAVRIKSFQTKADALEAAGLSE
jgi:ketosteroid isomerase-like protein